jgi:hypothetical protein
MPELNLGRQTHTIVTTLTELSRFPPVKRIPYLIGVQKDGGSVKAVPSAARQTIIHVPPQKL